MNYMWRDIKWLEKYDFKIFRLAVTGEPVLGWPTDPGVYMFARFERDHRTNFPDYSVLYVGETSNLFNRMSGHDKEKAALNRGWNQLHFHYEHDENTRKKIEKELLRHINPPLNDQVVLPW